MLQGLYEDDEWGQMDRVDKEDYRDVKGEVRIKYEDWLPKRENAF